MESRLYLVAYLSFIRHILVVKQEKMLVQIAGKRVNLAEITGFFSAKNSLKFYYCGMKSDRKLKFLEYLYKHPLMTFW